MTIQAAANQTRESVLSEKDFLRIAKVAKSGWGLNLDSAKKPLIRSRLGKRLQQLGLNGFDAYCKIIEAGDHSEGQHFVAALTTNVTHFYREVHHFEYLEKEVLPNLIAQASKGGVIRLWSAGCSSGQEPYSLAASILSIDSQAHKYDIRILATDIDPNVLAKAEAGEYAVTDCSFPSAALETRVFAKKTSSHEGRVVREVLRNMVTFRHLNLIQPWPITKQFDVIMCRNVAIYFDKTTQTQLWARFSQVLTPGGHLQIGHSERITDPPSLGLQAAGITTYTRHPSSKAVQTDHTKESACH